MPEPERGCLGITVSSAGLSTTNDCAHRATLSSLRGRPLTIQVKFTGFNTAERRFERIASRCDRLLNSSTLVRRCNPTLDAIELDYPFTCRG
jgi:hypothetical protein